MNKLLFLPLACVVLFGCKGTQNVKHEEKSSMEAFVGNYVSDGYDQRSEGYDWVGVSIEALNDSVASIAVRSRMDLKKPTCRFDAKATLHAKDTLTCNYEGKDIIFVRTDSTLTISTLKSEDKDLLCYFCSGGGSMAGTYKKIDGQLDPAQVDNRDFALTLHSFDNKFFFDIVAKGDLLTITPFGSSSSSKTNSTITQSIAGNTVVGAEIGDLNVDGWPEVLVYLTSDGSGSYGKVIGYSSNNGKSMSEIYLPEITEDKKISEGYMGHDEFAIVENTFCRRFPIYNPKDTNAKPTGKTRQVQYKLVNGEAGRIFKVDKVIEF